ncbi:MAG: hypothetical protein KY469_09290 [Actinobacteria bacterium]|nr:hypothetical protein [Actinomycetota bacterium]
MNPSSSTSSNRLIRRAIVASAGAALLLSAAAPALASPAVTIDVDWSCTSVHVSADKDLSNVVLALEDGDEVKFDGLGQGTEGTFSGTGDDADAIITTIWVKAGNNHSGDGPGYGERFDNPLDCTATQAEVDDDTSDRSNDEPQDEPTPDEETDEPGDESRDDRDDEDESEDDSDREGEDDRADTGDEGEVDLPIPAAPDAPADAPTPTVPDADVSADAADEQTAPTPAADDTDVLGIAFDRPAPRVVAASTDVRPVSSDALPRTGLPLAVLALGGLSSLLVGGAALRHGRRRDPDTTDVPDMQETVQGPTPPTSKLSPVSQSVTERHSAVAGAHTAPRTGVPSILIAATVAAALVAGTHVVRAARR